MSMKYAWGEIAICHRNISATIRRTQRKALGIKESEAQAEHEVNARAWGITTARHA